MGEYGNCIFGAGEMRLGFSRFLSETTEDSSFEITKFLLLTIALIFLIILKS